MPDKNEFLFQRNFRVGLKFYQNKTVDSYSEIVTNDGTKFNSKCLFTPEEAFLVERFHAAQKPAQIIQVLTSMWQKGKFCDLILVSASRHEFLAHRLVLASHSQKARIFFESRPHEFVTRIQLVDSNSKSVSSIVNFLYTGELVVDQNNLGNLVLCARELAIQGLLIEEIGTYLNKNLEQIDPLLLLESSRLLKLELLFEKVIQKVLLNFNKVIKSNEFLTLSLPTLLELVSACEPRGRVRNEKRLISRIVSWLYYNWDDLDRYDREDRQKLIGNIFENINFQKVNLDQVLEENLEIFSQIPEIVKLIKKFGRA